MPQGFASVTMTALEAARHSGDKVFDMIGSDVDDNRLLAEEAAGAVADAAAESPDRLYSITEMAQKFCVSLRTLRFYESHGLLHPQRIGTTRVYAASERQNLKVILAGKRLGLTLTEIGMIIQSRVGSSSIDDFVKVLKPDQIVAQINRLMQQRAELDDAIASLRNAHQQMADWLATDSEEAKAASK